MASQDDSQSAPGRSPTRRKQIQKARDTVGEATLINIINQVGALLDACARRRACTPDIDATVSKVLATREMDADIEEALIDYFESLEPTADEQTGASWEDTTLEAF